MAEQPQGGTDTSAPAAAPGAGAGLLATASALRTPAFQTSADPDKPAAFTMKAPIPISRTTPGTGLGRPPGSAGVQSFRDGAARAAEAAAPAVVRPPAPPAPRPQLVVPPLAPRETPLVMGEVVRPVPTLAPLPPAPAPPAATVGSALTLEPTPAPLPLPQRDLLATLPPIAPPIAAPAVVAPPAPTPPAPVASPAPVAPPAPAAPPLPPAPPPTAPVADVVPEPVVDPAAGWQTFAYETQSRVAEEDPFFRAEPRRADAEARGPVRRTEDDLIPHLAGSPARRRSAGRTVLVGLVVAGIAGTGAWLLTRPDGQSAPPVRQLRASADGTVAVAYDVPASATSGQPYTVSLPPGWTASSDLVGTRARHVDARLARPVLGISATISSGRDLTVPAAPAGTAVRRTTRQVAGAPATVTTWTAGVVHVVVTFSHAGTPYVVAAATDVDSVKQLTPDLSALLGSWTF